MDNTLRVKQITKKLETLNPTHLEVLDESFKHVGHAGYKTGKGHFKVIITSEKFNNLSRISIHKLIYNTIGILMETDIHALSIKHK